jgi:hypothetical protein
MFNPRGTGVEQIPTTAKKSGLLYIFLFHEYTDKKENQIFPIYKEILNGAVANHI